MPRQLWKAVSASGLSLTTVIAYGEEDARIKTHQKLMGAPLNRVLLSYHRKWVEDGEQVELWKNPSIRRSR